MKSSSTYLSYMKKMSVNYNIYSKLYDAIEFTRLNFNNFNKSIGVAYDLFKLGYTENDGSTLTGDKIVNVTSSSSNIYSSLVTLASSLKNEMNKAETSYNDFERKYRDALAREAEAEQNANG